MKTVERRRGPRIVPLARSATAAALAVVVASALAGCDPIIDKRADVAFGVVGGEAQFVTCAAIDATRVLAEERDFSDPYSTWSGILDAELAGGIQAGAPFSASDLPAGSTVSVNVQPDLRPGSTVSLFIGTSTGQGVVRTEFVVPSTGMPLNGWLRPDGRVAQEPCKI